MIALLNAYDDSTQYSCKDMFDREHNPSHSTLYPDVLKIKTIMYDSKAWNWLMSLLLF